MPTQELTNSQRLDRLAEVTKKPLLERGMADVRRLGAGMYEGAAPAWRLPEIALQQVEHRLKNWGTAHELLNAVDPGGNLKAFAKKRQVMYSQVAKDFSQMAEILRPEHKQGIAPEVGGMSTAEAAGTSIPLFAAGAMAAPFAMAMGAIMNGVPAYFDVLEETGDIDKATAAGLLSGGVGTSEVAGVGSAWKKALVKSGVGKWLFNTLITRTATEASQEYLQTGADQAIRDAFTEEDLDLLERALRAHEAGKVGGEMGAWVGLGFSVLASAGRYPGKGPKAPPPPKSSDGPQGDPEPEMFQEGTTTVIRTEGQPDVRIEGEVGIQPSKEEEKKAFERAALEDEISGLEAGQKPPDEGKSVEESVAARKAKLQPIPEEDFGTYVPPDFEGPTAEAIEKEIMESERPNWVLRQALGVARGEFKSLPEMEPLYAAVLEEHGGEEGLVKALEARGAPVGEVGAETAPEALQGEVPAEGSTEALPEDQPLPAETPIEQEPDFKETMAFPGSVLPDVKAALSKAREFFRRKAKVPDSDGLEPKGALDAMNRMVADSLAPLIKVMKKVPTELGARALDKILLVKGRTKDRIATARKNLFKPTTRLAKAAKIPMQTDPKKPDQPGIKEYLLARNAAERNATIQERRGGETEKGSGMSNEEAAKILSDAASSEVASSYEELGKRFDRITQAIRDTWVEGGLESQKYVDALEAMWKHYAPAKTKMDDSVMGYGRGVDIRGRESKAALGRKDLPDNPLAFAMFELQRAIYRAEKNKATQALGKFITENPELLEDFAKHVKGAVKKETLVKGVVVEVLDPSMRNREDIVAYKVDGKTKFIQFTERFIPLARSLRNENPRLFDAIIERLDEIVRESGKFSIAGVIARVARFSAQGKDMRILAQLSTRFNFIAFPPFNALRDMVGGVIQSMEHGYKFAAKVALGIPSAYRALTTGKGKMAEYRKRYERAGGPISFLDMDDINAAFKRLRRDLARVEGGTLTQIKEGWNALWDVIGKVADITENATRLSAFVQAIEVLGYSDERAAAYAKEMNTNFERRGDLGNMINGMFMFASAGIGGTRRGLKAVRSPKVMAFMGSSMAGMMIWDQIVRMALGVDDDGEDRYDKIPGYIKRKNLIVPVVGGKEGDYITFPFPFFFDFMFSSATNFSSALTGDITPSTAIGETGMAFADSFNPLGGGTEAEDIVTPTKLDPIVQIAVNRDFAGRTIAPTANPYARVEKPDSQMYWPDVNPIAKKASHVVNDLTGGDAYEAGDVDVSPETIEHWMQFATGGLGQTILRLYGVGEHVKSGERVKPHEIPLLRRLYREPSPFRSTGIFKEIMGDLDTRRQRAKGEEKRFKDEKLFKLGVKTEKALRDLTKDMHLKPIDVQDQIFIDADKIRQGFIRSFKEAKGMALDKALNL